MVQTQSQRDLKRAAERVTEVKALDPEENWSKIYGGLCHAFPILVRTCGLAQAVAYHTSKVGAGQKPQECAHKRLMEDFRDLIPDFELGDASVTAYMNATRRVLAAWVFYKRFAVSVLDAKADEARDDEKGE